MVDYRRLPDYSVTLSIISYGDLIPYKLVGLERVLDYRGVGIQSLHCTVFKQSIFFIVSHLRAVQACTG